MKKAIVGFTMGASAILFLATAAYANVEDRLCYWSPSANIVHFGGQRDQGTFGVRAGAPCRVPLVMPGWRVTVIKAEITEPPHNGTAVPRNDGDIYFYPKSGFTGKDSMTVRYVGAYQGKPIHGLVTYSIDVF